MFSCLIVERISISASINSRISSELSLEMIFKASMLSSAVDGSLKRQVRHRSLIDFPPEPGFEHERCVPVPEKVDYFDRV